MSLRARGPWGDPRVDPVGEAGRRGEALALLSPVPGDRDHRSGAIADSETEGGAPERDERRGSAGSCPGVHPAATALVVRAPAEDHRDEFSEQFILLAL